MSIQSGNTVCILPLLDFRVAKKGQMDSGHKDQIQIQVHVSKTAPYMNELYVDMNLSLELYNPNSRNVGTFFKFE